ncbi:hypothetical protein conserved [Leishmania donovani]|uniref:Uncharacterized protein n=3 Tax=Leishmania donovani species complex TaxID=38574 RepID=A4HZ47_LEIIN|nr:conserved hypothetical protein [Leishmania infantum JPCM5]CAC9485549.1 hypothetical_protein_-_conserved [Leishmania infantum]CAJ1988522.1 hypothetical protein conserved [Leishmania donovani]CAM67780.1 conserved hypothetical protein [Leishmania infantum JPCM5]SUZ41510.1 hypothetical_protein_-_conserved [Leishmania infantum]VDZ44403.1 hypothetical_protein_conserved [Leishmania donovani]|eukprot:XP_001465359.1 conserved hypothetical protein [Leishmania infantum JPCM5]
MDQLAVDLSALRELVLQHQHQQRLANDTHVGVDAVAVPSALSASTSAATVTTTADKLRQLQRELGALTEQLHAEKAASAQRLLQQRCDAASLQELLDQAARADEKVADLTSQLTEWKRRCQAVEEAHAGCTGQYESVREQVECVQRHAAETQAQHAVLTARATEAQRLVSKLADEKAQLQGTLRSRDAALLRLSGVELDRDEARARVQAFEAQHAEWVAEVCAYQRYFDSAREEYVRGLRHVASVRQEHEALREALTQSEARCVHWEKLFTDLSAGACAGFAATPADASTEEAAADISGASSAVIAVGVAEDGSPSSGGGCDASDCFDHPTSPFDAAFVPLLETKVADLALRLCDAQARADAAERTAEDLSRLSLADSTLLIHLKSLVCALRPQVDGVADHNAQLQARLLAAESFTDALMQHVVRLGEAFADEASQRCWLTAASSASAIGGGGGVDVLSGGSGGRGSETTLPPATPPSALTQSRRHRLRTRVLGGR